MFYSRAIAHVKYLSRRFLSVNSLEIILKTEQYAIVPFATKVTINRCYTTKME